MSLTFIHHAAAKRILARLSLAALPMACLLLATGSEASKRIADADDQLISLACDRDVVMLGENSHGDGATIAIKVRLVRRLVKECGFSAIVFESSFYDMEELSSRTPPDARYDRALFLSAIGRIWSQSAEFAPLADWVATQSPTTLTLGGMDPQLGSAGAFYSLDALPSDLVALLPEQQREPCRADMIGWIRWTTDRAAAQPRIAACLDAIEAELATASGVGPQLALYASSFRDALAWTGLQGPDLVASRDSAMAKRLLALRERLAGRGKVIVWTANAHAAYGGLEKGQPTARILKDALGRRLFTVAFSAAGGSFRWSRSEVREIAPAQPGDLERIVLGERQSAVADHADLAAIKAVGGMALGQHKREVRNWAELFDAVYVLAEERPKTAVVEQ